jgi:hypothetical protein
MNNEQPHVTSIWDEAAQRRFNTGQDVLPVFVHPGYCWLSATLPEELKARHRGEFIELVSGIRDMSIERPAVIEKITQIKREYPGLFRHRIRQEHLATYLYGMVDYLSRTKEPRILVAETTYAVPFMTELIRACGFQGTICYYRTLPTSSQPDSSMETLSTTWEDMIQVFEDARISHLLVHGMFLNLDGDNPLRSFIKEDTLRLDLEKMISLAHLGKGCVNGFITSIIQTYLRLRNQKDTRPQFLKTITVSPVTYCDDDKELSDYFSRA